MPELQGLEKSQITSSLITEDKTHTGLAAGFISILHAFTLYLKQKTLGNVLNRTTVLAFQ